MISEPFENPDSSKFSLPDPSAGPRGASFDGTSSHSIFDRRRMLLGGLAGAGVAGSVLLLGACAESSESKTPEVSDGTGAQLVAMFPRDVAYVAAGVPARLIYTVVDPEGVPAMELPDTVTFTVKQDDEQVGEPIEAKSHSEGIPRPYLTFPFTFPQKGVYDVYATVDGSKMTSPLIVVEPSEVKMPVIGQPLPAAPTATTADAIEVNPICTLVPSCPFHEHNLEDVVGTGKPIVLLLATPAYCQTTACGPILETLMEQAKSLPDDVIVIHSEVYKDPTQVEDINDATLAPLPLDYKMSFEPSLFVADSAGTLVARGDIVVDTTEMNQMLALAR